GVKFHDGTPFNAEAVKYNVERMKDPNFPSARRSEVLPVQKVTVIDPSTVALSLDRPYSPLLYVLTDRAGMIVSPAEGKKAGTDFALHPVGTGPFRFVEKIPQDHITLERNPDYWIKGQPILERIVYRPFPDDNARVANLKSGDVDIINRTPLPQIRQLAQEASQPGARFKLLEHGAFSWQGIWLNVTRPPFDNKLLRQAIGQAVQSMAADAGIQVKLQIVEFGTMLHETDTLQHQAAFLGWSGRPDPDFDIYPFVTQSGIGSFNDAGYTNPQVQTLLDAA